MSLIVNGVIVLQWIIAVNYLFECFLPFLIVNHGDALMMTIWWRFKQTRWLQCYNEIILTTESVCQFQFFNWINSCMAIKSLIQLNNNKFININNSYFSVLHLAIIKGLVDVAFALIRVVPHPDYLDLYNHLLQVI